MSTTKYRWWRYAIRMVQDFKALSTAVSLSTDDQRDRDAVAGAIQITMQQSQGTQQLALIQGVYWAKGKQTIENVSLQLDIPMDLANRWHGEFIRRVGYCWGFDVEIAQTVSPPGCKKFIFPGVRRTEGEA